MDPLPRGDEIACNEGAFVNPQEQGYSSGCVSEGRRRQHGGKSTPGIGKMP